MSLSNTSVLKQSDNAAGDAYESRRTSSSEKTRIAFIEVLRGVYMKKKGDTIPWSDIKKGYRKKTGRHLNGDELNAICGTKNLTKGEIIRTKFSPLFKFVDEKYQIISVSSNDCGGSGQHDENEFFCESCIKCGKMVASEIKFSDGSSSSNDENHSPRIDSTASDFSNNYPSNTALHMESAEIESAYDTVFQENTEVEAPVALPVQSPDALADEKTTNDQNTSSIPLQDVLKSNDTVETQRISEASEVQAAPEVLELDTTQQDSEVTDEEEAVPVPHEESKMALAEVVKTPTDDKTIKDQNTATAPLQDVLKSSDTVEMQRISEASEVQAAPEEVLELGTTQQDSEVADEGEAVPVPHEESKMALAEVVKTPTDDKTIQDQNTSSVPLQVVLKSSDTVETQHISEASEVQAAPEEVLELGTTQQDFEVVGDINGEAEAVPVPHEESKMALAEVTKTPTESEEDVTLNEVTEKSNKTDLEIEVDKELAVEKREKAHELMHRRRKAKCCNLM